MNGMKWDTYMYTMEHFSAFNRKKILTHAAMWMDLEDVILCNISQTEKTKKMRNSRAVIGNADAGSRSWLYRFSVSDSVWMALPL